MKSICTAVLILVVAGPAVGGAQDPVRPQGAAAPPSSAWDRSLALESSHDLSAARSILVDAYGPRPAIYDVCVRLAWLSLRQGRSTEAVELYTRARGLPGALPEATIGLSLAMTADGYRELSRGNVPVARRDWREALALDSTDVDARRGIDIVGPSSGAAPELWLASSAATSNSSTAQITYIGLPYRIDDEISVRAAYRHVGSPSAASGTLGLFGTQDELYAGGAFERGISASEAIGFILSNTVSTTTGVAIGERLGGQYGVTMMAAAMNVTGGTNQQFATQGFAWLLPVLAINGGVRLGNDPALRSSSGLLGMTLRGERVSLDVQGHLGAERFALNLAGPTIMSLNASTRNGVTITGAVALDQAKAWTLMAQVQFDRVMTPDGLTNNGNYTGLATGVRWLPSK